MWCCRAPGTEMLWPPLRVAALLLEDTELLGEPGWHHQHQHSPPFNELKAWRCSLILFAQYSFCSNCLYSLTIIRLRQGALHLVANLTVRKIKSKRLCNCENIKLYNDWNEWYRKWNLIDLVKIVLPTKIMKANHVSVNKLDLLK